MAALHVQGEKIAFLFSVTDCLERADKSVFVYTLKISSVGWELHITHTSIYTLVASR